MGTTPPATCYPRYFPASSSSLLHYTDKVRKKTLLSTEKTIGQMRGEFYDYNGIKLMPTYHPSYFLRNPSKKIFTWNDAVKVLNYLGISTGI